MKLRLLFIGLGIILVSSSFIYSCIKTFIWEHELVYKIPQLIDEYHLTDSLCTSSWMLQFGKEELAVGKEPSFLICNCAFLDKSQKYRPKIYNKKQFLEYLNFRGLICELNARELKQHYENKVVNKCFRDIDDSLRLRNLRFKPSVELFKKMKHLTDSLNQKIAKLDEYSNHKKLGVMAYWMDMEY
ncbi:hypothetical protein [uncultured Cytophaga sp.]|uniref:hypothetical protein n=1 Tax=uncultured Cytophaga sp. TaxID=160238 RepID=UPI0026340E43|nr:hypothetical protein [uncultured Cytophaga sp.]